MKRTARSKPVSRSWRANGCIDIICDALEEVVNKYKSDGDRKWFAPTYEPCSSGVRVNIESHDGAKAAIEFSLDDPQACSAVKEQLITFFGEALRKAGNGAARQRCVAGQTEPTLTQGQEP